MKLKTLVEPQRHKERSAKTKRCGPSLCLCGGAIRTGCLGFLAVSTVMAAHPALADIPGRLFFTQEQRLLLDNSRRQNIRLSAEERAASSGVTFSGIVKRSDGRATVWVNGHPVSGSEASRFGTLKEDSRQGLPVLTLPYPGRAVDLKVGQRLDPLSGKAVEAYAGKPKAESSAQTGTSEAATPAPVKPPLPASAPGSDLP